MEQHLYTKPSVWKMPSRSYGTLDLTQLGDPISKEQKSSNMENYLDEKCLDADERVIREYMGLHECYSNQSGKDEIDYKNWKDKMGAHITFLVHRNPDSFLLRFTKIELFWLKDAVYGILK